MSEKVFSNMVELKSEGLGGCQWEAGYAGMSWEGDCKGIGVRISHSSWSPAQMIASTEQGFQPASPSQQGQGCCKSHLLCGRRSGMPGAGGGMGGM